MLLALLAQDLLTIPYLTPFAHLLKAILSPFVPFLAPFFLGVFLKFCQHDPFPRKNTWLLISGAWLFQEVQRVAMDVVGLVGLVTKFAYDKSENRGFDEIQIEFAKEWLEVGLLVLVVVCQWRGWRWEGGIVDGWIEHVATYAFEEESKMVAQKEEDDMEKGVAGIEEANSTEFLLDEKKDIWTIESERAAETEGIVPEPREML